MSISIGPDMKARLVSYKEAGMKIKLEIKDLNDAFKDLTNTVAEELVIDKKVLTKMVATAMKNNMIEEREFIDAVEEILAAIGHA